MPRRLPVLATVRDIRASPLTSNGVALQLQRTVLERRVAETVAEGEQRCRRHVEVAFVDVVLGPPVAAAPFLGVVDRHLSHVPRERERQFPSGVCNAEDGVGDRGPLMRSPVVVGDDRRQLVDHGREGVRTPIERTATVGLPSAVTALISSTCYRALWKSSNVVR